MMTASPPAILAPFTGRHGSLYLPAAPPHARRIPVRAWGAWRHAEPNVRGIAALRSVSVTFDAPVPPDAFRHLLGGACYLWLLGGNGHNPSRPSFAGRFLIDEANLAWPRRGVVRVHARSFGEVVGAEVDRWDEELAGREGRESRGERRRRMIAMGW